MTEKSIWEKMREDHQRRHPITYDPNNYYVETDNTTKMEIELTPVQVNRIFKGVDAAALLDQGAVLKIKGKTYERAFGAKTNSN